MPRAVKTTREGRNDRGAYGGDDLNPSRKWIKVRHTVLKGSERSTLLPENGGSLTQNCRVTFRCREGSKTVLNYITQRHQWSGVGSQRCSKWAGRFFDQTKKKKKEQANRGGERDENPDSCESVQSGLPHPGSPTPCTTPKQ